LNTDAVILIQDVIPVQNAVITAEILAVNANAVLVKIAF